MSYESTIFVVRTKKERTVSEAGFRTWGDIIAKFDLSRLDYMENFPAIFDKVIDFDMYKEDGNTVYTTDDYGDKLCYAPIGKVIDKLVSMADNDGWAYRRWKPAISMLQAFDPNEWESNGDELLVVHYGH